MTRHLTIEAEGLVKHFGTTRALQGADLAVARGTVLGVLGPNGAGKTTAVRILSTLLVPDSGHGRINGLDVVRDAERVRQSIGLTSQYASIDEDLTGRQHLEPFGVLLAARRQAPGRTPGFSCQRNSARCASVSTDAGSAPYRSAGSARTCSTTDGDGEAHRDLHAEIVEEMPAGCCGRR